MILDVHTHHPSPQPQGIIALDIMNPGSGELIADGEQLYSAGIHPWSTVREIEDEEWRHLEKTAAAPNVVMIGETGIDTLRGGPLFRQMNIFRRHVELSERLGKPLILHIVKAHDQILGLRKELRAEMPWIVHGFRGKPGIARRYVDAGFYLSFGDLYNEDSLRQTPQDRILAETDESPKDIEDIIARLSITLNSPSLRNQLVTNLSHILPSLST
ncbi:MAG: TatD family hydrolase [Muribaculaceae bacterium]|nr:TatD family hydrolase [Muribaculaceae bacterium]